MMDPRNYQRLADLVLTLHVGIAVFVVGGLVLILFGGARGWAWVRKPWFRLLHLLAVGVIVADAWLGILCPLTSLEMWLRRQAGAAVYQASFIEYWLQRLLYVQAPPWVFTLAYTVFGLLVALSWWWVPPNFRRHR